MIPATVALARAEIADRGRFAELLGAEVPDNWPPESAADALDLFLGLLEANPSWVGWLGWYALEWRAARGVLVLVASAGFKGAPDADGAVEIGYSVLPQFEGRGIATEMARGLIEWARENGARRVLAQTTPDNEGSRAVLAKLGFVESGPGIDPGHTAYALELDAAAGA
jgi:RimJ/RimL family protein N-acetyltransferase